MRDASCAKFIASDDHEKGKANISVRELGRTHGRPRDGSAKFFLP